MCARHAEWISWIESARAWLGELAEEGIERIEPRPIAAPLTSPQPLSLFEDQLWREDTTLEGVRAALGDCKRCRLCEQRTQIVFGDGNPRAELMFVGEGPGVEEDRTGLPFVGRAGELLTAMIEKGLGISRSEVYICNIVKCRPPR